jgi:autotransporter-associated beta strand protein
MKSLIRNLRTMAAFAAALAIPHLASAAVKTWQTLAAAPATTNITAGVATNLTATITFRSGSGASARFVGPGMLSVSVSPPEPTVTVGLSQSTFTFLSTDTTFNPTLTVTTTAATPSNTYVVMIVGTTNPPVPTPPPSGYLPVTNSFTVTMATIPPFDPVKVWTNAGVNGNWSTAPNWSPNGAPGSSNDVRFTDAALVGTVGTVDNTVDTACTLGSLAYRQTNNYHTTLISSGLTLTLTGTNGLAAGTGNATGDGYQPFTTVQGPGAALVVSNTSANVSVDQSQPISGVGNSSTKATLDLSGLDTFTATISRILIGVDTSQALRGACGVLNLAKTNKITVTTGSAAPQIDVGDNTQSGGSPGLSSILLLGQTNAFFADSVAVGRGKSATADNGGGSSMLFNSSFANPVAYFRGTNGSASRVGMWSIGDAQGAKTSQNSGTNDFSLGTVNALVDQMFVGKGASDAILNGANVTGNGTLTFSAGTLDVNALEVGYSMTVPGSGTVNVNGGSLVVNTNLELAHGTGSSGALNVSGATVTANAGITAGGGTATITLNSATLNVTNAAATIGTAGSPLATLTVANSTLKVAAQNGTPSASVGTLSGGGAANTISISSVPVLSGLPAQFPILQYSTPDGDLTTFMLGTMPSASPAYAGYISNNTANSSIDLVITNGPIVYPLIWVGGISGDWDTTTLNWKCNGIPAKFQQGYLVVQFDDTLTAHSTVTLTTALTNGSLTVNNSLTNYLFTGTGKLSGGGSLTKLGVASLTLAESGGDDFTGGVTVGGGTLQVGNGLTSGTLPPDGKVSVESGAALVFDRSDNLAVSSLISGLGTITQNGASILALNGSNSAFAGEIIVAHGTVQAGNTAALGTAAASVMVSNTATLDVNGQKFNNNQLITVAGAGVGGNGAIVNNSTNAPNMILRNVTLTGNTTFGGYSDWDIHSTANPAADAALSTSGNDYRLTKVGTNTVTLFGAVVDGALGDIDVQAGTLSVERWTSTLGNPVNTVTVFTNANLQLANASNVWDKVVVLKDGASLRAINRDEFAGPVTLESGVGTVVANTGGQLILDAVVSGAGGLTKNGVGSLTLASASTYAGPTLVSQGTLALTGSGSIDSSTNITLSVGATVDLSALADPTLTLTAGRGLKGSGTVVGNVTMASGSTLTVGGPGTNTIGTLTVTNSLVLQAGSTNLMEVSKVGGTAASDQVVATNVTYGGTLTVTGAGGSFVAGDTFKLFSAGSYGGSFSLINLPVGTWDTSKLAVDGTIKVVNVPISVYVENSTNLVLSGSDAMPNGTYYVLASLVVTQKLTDWTTIATIQADGSGQLHYTYHIDPGLPRMFFTLSSSPSTPLTGVWDTEMLALDISGGGLPAGVMIRESPTLPSTGQTTITAPTNGGYEIISIFTNLNMEGSTDSNNTWIATEAIPIELVGGAAINRFPTPNLPPPEGEYYVSQTLSNLHARFGPDLLISNVVHRAFTASLRPPPAGAGPTNHTFGSQVDMLLSTDGGLTFRPVTAPATVTVRITHH